MAVVSGVGIGRSPVQNGSIESGQTSVGDPLNLGRVYAFAVIKIPDCSNIPASTSLRLQIGDTANDTMTDLYDPIDNTRDLATLPTSGTFRIVIPVFGAYRITPILSASATGLVTIQVYGVEPLIED